MINTLCVCGSPLRAAESQVNQQLRCGRCSANVRYVAADPLMPGAGEGDFDTVLVMEMPKSDGTMHNWQYFLGGIHDIEIGKLGTKDIQLFGSQVSREHCTLTRFDFGPSRWGVIDNNSTNGVYVNDERVIECELRHGDLFEVGEHKFKFRMIARAKLPK